MCDHMFQKHIFLKGLYGLEFIQTKMYMHTFNYSDNVPFLNLASSEMFVVNS